MKVDIAKVKKGDLLHLRGGGKLKVRSIGTHYNSPTHYIINLGTDSRLALSHIWHVQGASLESSRLDVIELRLRPCKSDRKQGFKLLGESNE